jgi:hypothetical protein
MEGISRGRHELHTKKGKEKGHDRSKRVGDLDHIVQVRRSSDELPPHVVLPPGEVNLDYQI